MDQQVSFLLSILRTSTELAVEKFLKKLAGRTDLEDAVKRLDYLTQEEARMALAEVLKIAHTVRDDVKVVIEGARTCSACRLYLLTFIRSDGKEAKLIIQQTVNSIDVIKCS